MLATRIDNGAVAEAVGVTVSEGDCVKVTERDVDDDSVLDFVGVLVT